jgi:N-acetylmuramoyl-L-alanine amidase
VLLERWCADCRFGAPRRISGEPDPAFAFTLTNGTMTIRIGSEVATWRGMDFHLGFAPRMIDGQPFVHAMDIRKNIMPLLEDPVRLGANRVIVIDPGHGGTDTGTTSVLNGHFEKEYVLDLARRLQALLVAQGWTVFLTHTSDVAMALPDRVAFAEQHKAALFVSLHFNSSFPDQHESGLETYCLTPQGMHSTETRGFADIPALNFPNNRFDTENMQFAACVQRELLKVNGHMDRGVKRARFLGVLRGQNRPAFLVEGGFLSNPAEARKIADPAYREKIAEAIARALQDEATPRNIAAQAEPVPAASQMSNAVAKQTAAVSTNATAGAQGAGND